MRKQKRQHSFISLFYFVVFFFFFLFFASYIIQQVKFQNTKGEEERTTKTFQRENSIEDEEAIPASVIRVVDGDTLLVWVGGKRERVRLIGIDSPESVKPESPVECYGEEAKDYLKSLLPTSTRIFLKYDETQGKRDRFGRILAYMFTEDGKNIAEEILRNGYAREYNYQKENPYLLHNRFLRDEQEAKAKQKGLWAVCH